jgi:hypothetical protein
VFYSRDHEAYDLGDILHERVSLKRMIAVWLLKLLHGTLRRK